MASSKLEATFHGIFKKDRIWSVVEMLPVRSIARTPPPAFLFPNQRCQRPEPADRLRSKRACFEEAPRNKPELVRKRRLIGKCRQSLKLRRRAVRGPALLSTEVRYDRLDRPEALRPQNLRSNSSFRPAEAGFYVVSQSGSSRLRPKNRRWPLRREELTGNSPYGSCQVNCSRLTSPLPLENQTPVASFQTRKASPRNRRRVGRLIRCGWV